MVIENRFIDGGQGVRPSHLQCVLVTCGVYDLCGSYDLYDLFDLYDLYDLFDLYDLYGLCGLYAVDCVTRVALYGL